MVDIVGSIFKVAEMLSNRKGKMATAERATRLRIADYLSDISECLNAVHDTLKAGDYPHRRCEEMGVYAGKMPEIIDESLVTNVNELSKTLWEARFVEELYNLLSASPERDQQLAKLAKASGLFHGTAVSLRAE